MCVWVRSLEALGAGLWVVEACWKLLFWGAASVWDCDADVPFDADVAGVFVAVVSAF